MTRNQYNKKNLVALLGVAALGLAGCQSTTMSQTQNFQRNQVPISDIGVYGSNAKFQTPKYTLDSEDGHYIPNLSNSKDRRIISENYVQMRPQALCPTDYSLRTNIQAVFEDGSICPTDLCKYSPSTFSIRDNDDNNKDTPTPETNERGTPDTGRGAGDLKK